MRHAAISPSAHAGLRLRRTHGAAWGDNVMLAPLFPHEFRQAQAFYPIVFSPEAGSGRARPYALFGLERDSNLFLSASGWDAAFIPAAHRMQPFLIGRGPGGLQIHADLDHPRFSETEGEPLFGEDGAQTGVLDEIAGLLGEVHEAEQQLPAFCAMLAELRLLEPFTLEVTLDSGRSGRLEGFLTLAEERLLELDGPTLGRLQAAGFLSPVFMALASQSQFLALIGRLNQREAGAL